MPALGCDSSHLPPPDAAISFWLFKSEERGGERERERGEGREREREGEEDGREGGGEGGKGEGREESHLTQRAHRDHWRPVKSWAELSLLPSWDQGSQHFLGSS